MSLSRRKRLLALLTVPAAVLALGLCALLPDQFLLWTLLAMILLIPAAEELGLAAGLAVFAVSAFLALLLPIFQSALPFALMGSYAILRPRIEALPGSSLRTGIRVLVVVLSSTLLFQILRFFYGEALAELTGGADALLLAILLVLGALYFLLVNWLLDRCTAIYRSRLHRRVCGE